MVEEMERGDRTLRAINRKHANHLESYFKRYFAKSNAHTTLHPIRHKYDRLRIELRGTDLSDGHCVIGEPLALALRPSPSQPHLQSPTSPTHHPRMQTPDSSLLILPSTPLSSHLSGGTFSQNTRAEHVSEQSSSLQNSVISPILEPTSPGPIRPTSRPPTHIPSAHKTRTLPVCQICGHMRWSGYFKQFHTRTACNVPDVDRCSPCFCNIHLNRRKRWKRHYHVCNCPRCTIAL